MKPNKKNLFENFEKDKIITEFYKNAKLFDKKDFKREIQGEFVIARCDIGKNTPNHCNREAKNFNYNYHGKQIQVCTECYSEIMRRDRIKRFAEFNKTII